mgnify:CR=1 FL=1
MKKNDLVRQAIGENETAFELPSSSFCSHALQSENKKTPFYINLTKGDKVVET